MVTWNSYILHTWGIHTYSSGDSHNNDYSKTYKRTKDFIGIWELTENTERCFFGWGVLQILVSLNIKETRPPK